MSHLQNFLRDSLNKTSALEYLEHGLGIEHKRHKKHPNLILFKYNQLVAPMANPIVQSARGVILDEANNWEIVCRPFDKFFNHGEPNAHEINWHTAVVYEKLDGSLCSLYYYNNEWHVATTGSPDASGPVLGHDFTFADLFWRTFKAHGYNVPAQTGLTFMFELMCPENRVVVQHQEPKLVLIGIRHNSNGQEFPAEAQHLCHNFQTVKCYGHKFINELTDTIEERPGNEFEGYVVRDAWYRRIKVKNPKYVLLHQMKDHFSFKRAVELVKNGGEQEINELVTYFPDLKPTLDEIKVRYDDLVAHLKGYYNAIKHIESQKEFALQAVKSRYSSALFSVRKEKDLTIEDALSRIQPEKMMELLGYK